MRRNQNYTGHILLGTLVGGALIAGVTALFATKQGKRIRKDLSNRIQRSQGKIYQFLDTINEVTLNGKKIDWIKKAKKIAGSIRNQLEDYAENEDMRSGLLTGVVVGGVIGAAGVLLISKMREDSDSGFSFIESIGNRAGSIKNAITDALDVVEDRAERTSERFRNRVEHDSNTIDNIVDIASAGINLWQTIKRR